MYSSNYYGSAIFETTYDYSFIPHYQIRHDQGIHNNNGILQFSDANQEAFPFEEQTDIVRNADRTRQKRTMFL